MKKIYLTTLFLIISILLTGGAYGNTQLKRPFLEKDGGDISLDSISDNKIVNVKLHGTCVGCKVNQMTLKLGVETIIKRHAPHIEKVNSVL